MGSLNEFRVLESAPGKLGEGVAEGCDPLSLHLEPTLLRHGCIPAVFQSQLGCLLDV